MDSLTLLGHLQALERRLAEVPQYVGRISAARAGRNHQSVLRAQVEGSLHLRAVTESSDAIRDAVIGRDGLGVEVDSLSELAHRAMLYVIMEELRGMRANGPLLDCWPSAEWMTISEELEQLVRARLAWWISSWYEERARLRRDRWRYREFLHAVQMSVRVMCDEAAPVLARGAASDAPPLVSVCHRLRTAMSIRIDVQAEQAIFVLVTHEVPKVSGAK